ncbi:MAG: hypothetical protein ACQESN_10775 [Thermotogota bacterium]
MKLNNFFNRAIKEKKYVVGCSLSINNENGNVKITPFFSYPKGLNIKFLHGLLNFKTEKFLERNKFTLSDLYTHSKMFILVDRKYKIEILELEK